MLFITAHLYKLNIIKIMAKVLGKMKVLIKDGNLLII